MQMLPSYYTLVLLSGNENEGVVADGVQYVRVLVEKAVGTSPVTNLWFPS